MHHLATSSAWMKFIIFAKTLLHFFSFLSYFPTARSTKSMASICSQFSPDYLFLSELDSIHIMVKNAMYNSWQRIRDLNWKTAQDNDIQANYLCQSYVTYNSCLVNCEELKSKKLLEFTLAVRCSKVE